MNSPAFTHEYSGQQTIPGVFTTITEAISEYASHQLSDLKSAVLMDRVDTKYLLPTALVDNILQSMLPYYSILEIDGARLFNYQNTYFDTPDYLFYHMHHRGKLNRYKVRQRHYVETQTSFLEVKFKNNKERTIKNRLQLSQALSDNQQAQIFLAEQIGEYSNQLKPVQTGGYQRIALANEFSGERVTLDFNLYFEDKTADKNISIPNMVIAELKQSTHRKQSPFAKKMSQLNMRSSKFSKYCMGCLMLTPELKANRLKPQKLALARLN